MKPINTHKENSNDVEQENNFLEIDSNVETRACSMLKFN